MRREPKPTLSVRPGARPARQASLIALTCLTMLACPAGAAAAAGQWSVQPVAHPVERVDSTLYGVSCRSSTWCMAVGGTSASRGQLFAELWDGHTWSLLHPPLPRRARQSQLSSISCMSTTACIATGGFMRGGQTIPLAARWNGARWTLGVLPTPPRTVDAGITGVSCPSVGFCVAVGSWTTSGNDNQALVEQMRGSKWHVEALSSPGTRSGVTDLAGVSCTSEAACTAVGSDDAGDGIALRWNGRNWTFQLGSNPNLWSGSELYGVACVSRTTCAAAGGGNNSNSAGAVSNASVAEWWNGARWKVSERTDPTNTNDYDLFAVSCTSRTDCLAVGFVAEHWNGRSWALEQIPAPTVLQGISCPTRMLCVAVGNRSPRHGPTVPVAARWSGGRR